MITSDYFYRVTYADTDKMGYLYYGNYARIYEIGRVETLRQLGCTYRDLEDEHGVMLPVVSSESRYLRPALYDELLKIRTSIPVLPTKMIHFDHEIFNEAGASIHKATVKLFFVDMKTQGRISCPDWLTDIFTPYFSL